MAVLPDPLVIVERTFSMSAGLAASTVTPGMTAPESSRTVPVIEEVCANAEMGRTASKPARQIRESKPSASPTSLSTKGKSHVS